jgi:DNA-binding NtrC family response regulator
MSERILVVDDEPDMLKFISMILRETESQVVTTSDPIEALELARIGEYDLVITDLKMPGLDGIELLNSIRSFNSDIPVIIITAYATAEAAADAMSNAAFDFITKPFRKEQLLFTLDKAFRWLKIKRENRMLREMLTEKG